MPEKLFFLKKTLPKKEPEADGSISIFNALNILSNEILDAFEQRFENDLITECAAYLFFEQFLLEFLTNAARKNATEMEFTVHISEATLSDDSKIVDITLRDNGDGLSSHIIPGPYNWQYALCHPSEYAPKENEVVTDRSSGQHLALALCAYLLAKANGSLYLVNNEPRGAMLNLISSDVPQLEFNPDAFQENAKKNILVRMILDHIIASNIAPHVTESLHHRPIKTTTVIFIEEVSNIIKKLEMMSEAARNSSALREAALQAKDIVNLRIQRALPQRFSLISEAAVKKRIKDRRNAINERKAHEACGFFSQLPHDITQPSYRVEVRGIQESPKN